MDSSFEVSPVSSGVCSPDELGSVLLIVVRSLVSQPERVSMTVFTIDRHTDFSVFVSEKDVGKVIGRNGRTVVALRVLLSALGKNVSRKYSFNVESASALLSCMVD